MSFVLSREALSTGQSILREWLVQMKDVLITCFPHWFCRSEVTTPLRKEVDASQIECALSVKTFKLADDFCFVEGSVATAV